MYYVYTKTKEGEYAQQFKSLIAAQLHFSEQEEAGHEVRLVVA